MAYVRSHMLGLIVSTQGKVMVTELSSYTSCCNQKFLPEGEMPICVCSMHADYYTELNNKRNDV